MTSSSKMALLLLLVTTSVRAALIQGPVAAQLLRASPLSIQYNADCVVDKLYEGPSCDTFFMCMDGRTSNHQLVLFSCGQGTMFDTRRSVCVHAQPSPCPNGPDRITAVTENSLPPRPPTEGTSNPSLTTSLSTSSISLSSTSRPSTSTHSPTATNGSPSPSTQISTTSPGTPIPSPPNLITTQSTPIPPSPSTRPSTPSPPSPTISQSTPSPPSPITRPSTPSPPSPATAQSTPSPPTSTTRPSTPSPPSPTNRPNSPSPPSPTTSPTPNSLPSPPGPPPFVLVSRPPSPPGFQPPKLFPPNGPFTPIQPTKPSKPSRPSTALKPKRPKRPGGFLGSILKPLIAISPFGLDDPEPQGSPTCPKYSLDPTSLVNCTREGRWEHPGDCNRFYQCIHTMDCILKGFIFRCPDNFHFVKSRGSCEALLRPTPCHKFSDVSAGSFTYPVIQLEEESINQFQQASAYWDYMPFLLEQS